MFDKFLFGLENYLILGVFTLACYGWGQWFSRSWRNMPALMLFSSTLALGMGILILALQLLGIAGLLLPPFILGLLALGLFFAALHYRMLQSSIAQMGQELRQMLNTPAQRVWMLILLLLSVELLLRPLQVPLAFDELMYHMPHAKGWSLSGHLDIHPWMRYPYFPYNFNLLYAAGLSLGSEGFAHTVLALSGWLVMLGMLSLAHQYWDTAIACLSVLLFAILNLAQFGTAMIDLGLCLFIFYSFCFLLFWSHSRQNSLLFAAAFLFGIAAGIKYQALVFAPLMAVIVLWQERKLKTLAVGLFLFCIPAVYWYARNYLLTGDPFSPMGASLFGYFDWNAGDMQLQLADIRIHKDWPNWSVWPALGIVFFWSRRNDALLKAAVVFSGYGFLAWLVTSHYARYLMPVTPAICMLTAYVVCETYAILMQTLRSTPRGSILANYLTRSIAVLFVLLLAVMVIFSANKNIRKIQANPQAKAAFLKTQIRSYEIGEFLHMHPEYRVLQFDFGSDNYYLPLNTVGDIFGPGRTRDFVHLDTPHLAQRMHQFGVNALLLPGDAHQIAQEKGLPLAFESDAVKQQADFLQYFVLVKKTPEAELYALRRF